MPKDKHSPAHLSTLLQSLQKEKGLPPVHLWNPDFCGDIDMTICSDGHWEYMGSPIRRESMVKLFSTVLRHDDDGFFYLVTPVEKVRIKVEDVPFVALAVGVVDGFLVFTTNVGDKVVLDETHPLRMSDDLPSVPYIRVRDRLEARIHRNVFYQLVDLAEERVEAGEGLLAVRSGDQYYSLGSL